MASAVQPAPRSRGQVVVAPDELVARVGAERLRRLMAAWLDEIRSLDGAGGKAGITADIRADGTASDGRTVRERRL